MCGTINPTNPTRPARTTLAAASSDDAARTHPLRAIQIDTGAARARFAHAQRVERWNAPRPLTRGRRLRTARPSRDRASRVPPSNRPATPPPAPAKSLERARTIASVVIAANNVDNETPAKIKRLVSIPLPRRASAATRIAAPSPAPETERRKRGRCDAGQQCDRDPPRPTPR